MINIQTQLIISDNSGAVLGKCISIPKKCWKKGAKMGDIILVTLKKVIIKKNLKKSKRLNKSQICKAIILRTARSFKRWGNFFIKGYLNNICIINNFNMPYASRIFGPIFREVKQDLSFKKLSSIAQVIF